MDTLDFNGWYKITFRDTNLPRRYLLQHAVFDVQGHVIYLVTSENEYINHDNVLKFKKVEG